MAASTLVASILTGSGVLAASLVTQVVGARMETKRAEREDKRLAEDRAERQQREQRERDDAITRERREHQRAAYVRLIALTSELASAADDLGYRASAGNVDLSTGREVDEHDREAWADAASKYDRLSTEARDLSVAYASERVYNAFQFLSNVSICLDINPFVGYLDPNFYFLYLKATDTGYSVIFRDKVKPTETEALYKSSLQPIRTVTSWCIKQLRYEIGVDVEEPKPHGQKLAIRW